MAYKGWDGGNIHDRYLIVYVGTPFLQYALVMSFTPLYSCLVPSLLLQFTYLCSLYIGALLVRVLDVAE